MASFAREQTALRVQAQVCSAMGSSLYGQLLERAADGDDGGDILALLAERPAGEDFLATAVVLRMMASVHRLALRGAAPALAAQYPSCGGAGDFARAWDALTATVREHRDTIASELDAPLQTNEAMRSAALLGGFLLVAQRYGLPLRLLEIGASAGFALRWDHYRYRDGPWSWGPEASVLQFTACFEKRLPFPHDLRVTITERAGCDLDPIDPGSDAGRQKLLSFVWADQLARIERLSAACEVARALPVRIDRALASAWLPEQLALPRAGETTVVFHTVVWQYLDSFERETILATLEAAGKRATDRSPLAYLTLEPAPAGAGRVAVRLWPGSVEKELARASLHGDTVAWAGDEITGCDSESR